MTDKIGEPACDISGLCEPLPEDEDQSEAMCMHCGGWRYKDSPRLGNWGTEPIAIAALKGGEA